MTRKNLDERTVASFGHEWSHFDQSQFPEDESKAHFDAYFRVFPWADLPPQAVGFDLGCGSGRWAKLVAPRVHVLHCVDASAQALDVARRALAAADNCQFHHRSVDDLPFADASMDFGYSLGVLHHVPDTAAGLRACVKKLRIGAPFLVYLYYAFDNRPSWYRWLWRASELLRRSISEMPDAAKPTVTTALAAGVYWPLARAAKLVQRAGLPARHMPLFAYRDASFYTMKTDALDRFGTPLEQRFTQAEMKTLMITAGLEAVRFSNEPPYWCAVGTRVR